MLKPWPERHLRVMDKILWAAPTNKFLVPGVGGEEEGGGRRRAFSSFPGWHIWKQREDGIDDQCGGGGEEERRRRHR